MLSISLSTFLGKSQTQMLVSSVHLSTKVLKVRRIALLSTTRHLKQLQIVEIHQCLQIQELVGVTVAVIP